MNKEDIFSKLALYVDGEWLGRTGRDVLPVVNPATGEVLGELPLATEADLKAALSAAQSGFAAWRKKSPSERSGILRSVARRLRECREELSLVLTLEQGKPLAESAVEVERSAQMMEWYADEGRRAYGVVIPADRTGVRQYSVPEPIGPIGAFSPWNVPLVTPVRKIAGALAAGCSVILKPSEETPGVALMLGKLFEEAGLPKGVLNIVFGDPAFVSGAVIASEIIRGITFTGSTAVGKSLAAMAMRNMQRVVMELGGHAPVLVFDDVDAERVGVAAANAKYRNAGQICTSPTRFFVHERIYDRFAEAFVARARSLRVGDGRDPATEMGPLANDRRVAAMEALVEDAEARGIRIATGGKRCTNQGSFFEPTVLLDMTDDCLASNIEPFGPLAGIAPFTGFDEVIARANRLPYGLASYVMTNRTSTALAASEALEAGNVILNHWTVSSAETPFGGVKESGVGSEGGTDGLKAFQNIKFVSLT